MSDTALPPIDSQAEPEGPLPTERPDAAKSKKKAQPRKVEATLASFFEEKPIGAAAFVGAVRNSGRKRFEDADVAAAMAAMPVNDPVGTRLLSLAGQPKLPPPLSVWVRPTVLARLRERLPGRFEMESGDAATIFRGVLEDVSPKLTSEFADARLEARTLLLLALTWLTPRSTFKPREALEEIYGLLFADEDGAEDAVVRALSGGEMKGIRQASAVAGLARRAVSEATERAEKEHSRRLGIEDELAAARREAAALKAQVASLTAERDDFRDRLSAAERRFEERQQHWGNDMAAVSARQKLLLDREIGPLLDTAVDALAGDPPFPDIALERVREALTIIKEAAR
ncbi:hypothetical protein [Methylobacterium sp. D48H]